MVGSLVTDTLASNPVLLLFVVAALGFAVGRIRVGGFSLGVAAVMFAGIAVGALDNRLKLPDPFWVLGLALFVYTVALTTTARPESVPKSTPTTNRCEGVETMDESSAGC